MLALARVGVLVQGRAVEEGQAVRVLGEMGGHPVDHHADAGLVAAVHQVHEILRRAEAAVWGEVANRLVTPRARVRVLHDGEQLDVRVTQARYVLDQLLRDLAVRQDLPLGAPQPGFQVYFVNGNRLSEQVPRGALLHPGRVAPFVLVPSGDDGTRSRGHLALKSVRVRLHLAVAGVLGPHEVLVCGPLADARQEDLPDAPLSQPHGMPPGVPVVEFADDRDYLGAGSPDREAHALDAFHADQLRAEGVVALVVGPLAVQMQLELGKERREAIGILKLDGGSVMTLDTELVVARAAWEQDREKTFGMTALHGGGAVIEQHGRLRRLWQECPNLPSRKLATGPHRVGAKDTEGIAVVPPHDGVDLRFRHRSYYGRDGCVPLTAGENGRRGKSGGDFGGPVAGCDPNDVNRDAALGWRRQRNWRFHRTRPTWIPWPSPCPRQAPVSS